ncbi:hypothetical protein D7I43_32035 [Micromonospora globbae]|uniref:Uncharacterized protein n=1 Tax=Micromonospora globbae TaxID=1894969 RepID=A0A420EEQ5_9ACTN|nr:hypothetical protein D7I43_32035 [Micromonospora globbae]
MRTYRLTRLLVLAVFVLAGCGLTTSGEDAADEPELDVAAVGADPRNVSFPLDVSRVTGEQSLVIIHARDLVMQRCLARFGFDLPMRPPVGQDSADIASFGLIDERRAQERGYLRDIKETGPEFISQVPPEATPVLTGNVGTYGGVPVPEGGCQGESFRAVTGGDSMPKDGNFVESLRHEAWSRALDDSRVQRLLKQWRSCLKDAGFPEFKDPGETYTYWQGKRKPKVNTPSQEEVAMAVADVRCKQQVKLLPTWIAANVAYQNRLAEENAQRLAEYKAYVAKSMELANQIVSGG